MTYDPAGAGQYSDPGAPAGDEWSVSITDDDQRTMTPAQIVQEYQRGTLDLQDTFVWREGMGDWITLGAAPELMALLQAGGPSQPAYSSPGAPDDGAGSTVALDDAANAGGSSDAAAVAAARRDAGAAVDIFDQQAASSSDGGRAVPSPPRRLGERNEASSLFSVNDILSASPKRDGGASPKGDAAGFDDLMGLGGGGIASSAFAPPPLDAPVPEPPPPPKPDPAVQAQLIAAAQFAEPPRKSHAGLIIAAVMGVALFGVITIYFLMRGPSEETTAAASVSGDETSNDDQSNGEKADDETSDDETSDDETSDDEKSDDEKSDDEKSDDEKSADSKSGSSKVSSGGPSSTGTKDDKKDTKTDTKTDTKKDDKKDDEKDDKPKGEFSRDAARAALSGAAGAASGCKRKGGPTGRGRVSVTFAPSGRATTANVGPPFAGTKTGSCAAAAFRRASVPPFSGGPVTVSKSFFIR